MIGTAKARMEPLQDREEHPYNIGMTDEIELKLGQVKSELEMLKDVSQYDTRVQDRILVLEDLKEWLEMLLVNFCE
jgi:hypothetical protein